MKNYLLLIILLFAYFGLFAQNDENKENTSKKLEVSLEGMLAASAGKKFYAFNVGGPALGLNLNNNIKLALLLILRFTLNRGKQALNLVLGQELTTKT